MQGEMALHPTDYAGIAELQALERNMFPWLRQKGELLSAIVEGNRILDIGCGIGSLTQFLIAPGREVTGLEKSAACIAKACEKQMKATFVQGNILDISKLADRLGFFDTVVMSDVLEHIEDEGLAIHNASLLLRNRGVLLLTVPANSWLYSELDRKVGHYRRYSRNSLARAVKRAGLCVELCRFWNVPGLIGWAVVFKLLGRGVETVRSPNLMQLYGYWLGLENRVNFPMGLTLVAKARKLPYLPEGELMTYGGLFPKASRQCL